MQAHDQFKERTAVNLTFTISLSHTHCETDTWHPLSSNHSLFLFSKPINTSLLYLSLSSSSSFILLWILTLAKTISLSLSLSLSLSYTATNHCLSSKPLKRLFLPLILLLCFSPFCLFPFLLISVFNSLHFGISDWELPIVKHCIK